MSSDEKTRYERLAGYAITAVANDLLALLQADPQLGSLEVPMCIVYCFDEAGKLSEQRGYIDEARMMP